MTKAFSIASFFVFFNFVLAHTIFQVFDFISLLIITIRYKCYRCLPPQELYVNGVDQGHITGIRVPDYDGVRIPFSLSFRSIGLHYDIFKSLSRMSPPTI